MKPVSLMTVLTAFIVATTSPAGAQSQTQAKAEQPEAFHAGGRHDERAHKATLRAEQQGWRMAEPEVHPGGRHDEFSHRAALRAQRAANEAAKR
jgi:hypothetical protein